MRERIRHTCVYTVHRQEGESVRLKLSENSSDGKKKDSTGKNKGESGRQKSSRILKEVDRCEGRPTNELYFM